MSTNKSEKICVIGLGYIGLPTASLLGTKGFKVTGVDTSKYIVETINNGGVHIVEPELDVMVKSAINSGNMNAVQIPVEADIFIIAVPTPFNENKEPNIDHVHSACIAIANVLKENNLIILESTSPIGTTKKIKKWIMEIRSDLKNFYVAHCPERVLPGKILFELVENDRIVGGVNQKSTIKAVEFYQKFVSGKIYATNANTAELCKLVENSYRDVNIAFANELSMICDQHKINVWELIRLANHHPRVNILQPGPGVGGHCIAVDPWFIVAAAKDTAHLIKTARDVNDSKPDWIVSQIIMKAKLQANPVIGCLGVTYKADVDDIRESPALLIIKKLQKLNIGEILACEPNLNESSIISLISIKDILSKANILVLLVDHKEFKELSLEQLQGKTIVDTRGIW
jgi:UDP-N-acetyl-D-mannosaminuronic acid dehydrogenase